MGFSRQEYWSGVPSPSLKNRTTDFNWLSRKWPGLLQVKRKLTLMNRKYLSSHVSPQRRLLLAWIPILRIDWKEQTVTLLFIQSLGREDPLEKEMATHSSTLAWKIPWMEEPGRLQSMGSQRVRHDCATELN